MNKSIFKENVTEKEEKQLVDFLYTYQTALSAANAHFQLCKDLATNEPVSNDEDCQGFIKMLDEYKTLKDATVAKLFDFLTFANKVVKKGVNVVKVFDLDTESCSALYIASQTHKNFSEKEKSRMQKILTESGYVPTKISKNIVKHIHSLTKPTTQNKEKDKN